MTHAPDLAAVKAVAEAWASIDGKLEKYRGDDGSDPTLGYREGYDTEATTLMDRLLARGFEVTPTEANIKGAAIRMLEEMRRDGEI